MSAATWEDEVARAFCRERCAMYGEPPCFDVEDEWPNPACESGAGCFTLARIAASIAPKGEGE